MSYAPRTYEHWRSTPDGQLVFDEVRRRALRLRQLGYKHFGAQALFEAIRYDSAVRLVGDGKLRLNNSHVAPLAREVMASDSRLTKFFETRRSAADHR